MKADSGKARFDLIPAQPLKELAELLTLGARKYEVRDWEKGMPFSRMYSAMQRHAWAWQDGEERDSEDGQPHLIAVTFCAMALREYEVRKNGTDDRPRVKRRRR